MPAQYEPTVGDWYKTLAGDSFEIVAYDEDDQTVEIQYEDGSIEELDLDTWYDLELEPIDSPGDWSGSLDMDREDFDKGVERDLREDWPYSASDFDFED